MFNDYLKDIVSINSEFIYESIMIEGITFSNIVEKIKTMWEKFLNFLKKIKNMLLNLIKKAKSQILSSQLQIEFEDYSDHISEYKNIISEIENRDINTINFSELETRVILRCKSRISINNTGVSLKDAVKTLEYRITEVEQITNRFKKIMEENIFNKLNRLKDEVKDGNETSNKEIDRMFGKAQAINDLIIKSLTELINSIKYEIEFCYKQSQNKYNDLPSYIDKSRIKNIENTVEEAREEIIFWLTYEHTDKDMINIQKYLINYAEQKYGDSLYDADKHINGEEKWLYGLTVSNIKKQDLSYDDYINKYLLELKYNASNMSFSKKKINFLIGKVYEIEKYFKNKK